MAVMSSIPHIAVHFPAKGKKRSLQSMTIRSQRYANESLDCKASAPSVSVTEIPPIASRTSFGSSSMNRSNPVSP